MRCFYLPEVEFRCGSVVALPIELKRHLQTVLRLQPGAEIQLFNGCGQVARSVLKENSRVEFLEIVDYPAPPCSLILIQGLPKGDKLELILQKGTEVGVNEFCLLPMARSVSQLKSSRKEKRLERWQKIIQEAARQCRQYHLPTLTLESSFNTVLSTVDADLKLLLWEDSAEPLATVLPQTVPQRVAVVVGPEGGITAQEAAAASAAGYRPVSLGPRILRTETAGLAIMTILQYLYGDLAAGQHG
ncbi:MAG: 16S rRNA (uracil(1498)-N(3))-methyltransferase [Desulfuromonadales bacterium]|nr:16S rRNA (uracil(1498)-N(3))-methyltransferase [Desulfuromonadales bacterium]